MSGDGIALVWFRQDLRLADNPALRAAVAANRRVLPVYILDDDNAGPWRMGAASRAWLHRSLEKLEHSLDGGLRYLSGDAKQVIARLIVELPIERVYWNRCYEPWRRRRDAEIKRMLTDAGIEAQSFNASLLWEPWSVRKQDGGPYRVFTPFYRKGCLAAEAPRSPLPPPRDIPVYPGPVADALVLDALSLRPALDWHRAMLAHWSVGEDAAQRRLETFCADRLSAYAGARDYPARDATSKLSPHLHFGELSPHQAWRRAAESDPGAGESAASFQRELAWREFSYHLLYHFPDIADQNFNPRFDAFEWRDDAGRLEAWRRGETGYPIVDAGLRELWQTGYMHNRVRMVVASFLVKNLLSHWRTGADWFWDCLVDADLANNSASWQWCAGSGADAAPYFRIFNPVRQSEKFDPEGEYLARYCPELAPLPVEFRHRPWEAPQSVLGAAGLRLDVDYPRPILDLKVTRERALERYRALG